MISKQAVLEILNDTPMPATQFIRLMDKINALPSISDGWISVQDRLPEVDGKDQEFLCEDFDGYVVCWYKLHGFIECYTLMEVTPIRYKPLIRNQ